MGNIVEKAKKFAEERHAGQFRRDGVTPYFRHLLRVVNLSQQNRQIIMCGYEREDRYEILMAVAYLHDIIEDGKATRDELEEMFGVTVAQYVKLLTHNPKKDYFEYIRKIKSFGYGVEIIKLADILDNLSDSPTEKQVKKYSKALKIFLGFEE
ncbi:MAG: HD domain-containing protein [Candidatus Paceibacterota bacterium]